MATIVDKQVKLEHHEVGLVEEVMNSRISQWQYNLAHRSPFADQKEALLKKIKTAENLLNKIKDAPVAKDDQIEAV